MARPNQSGYGLHLVYIDKKTPEYIAILDEVKSKVKRDYKVDSQKKALDAFYDELQTRYQVIVEKKAP